MIAIIVAGNAGATGATNVTTSPGVDTDGANLIVVGCTSNTGIPGLSDNKSNIWQPLTSHDSLSGFLCRLFYCFNPIVGTGHTFSTTGSTYAAIGFVAVSGAASYDQESGSNTTGTPGSITPASNGALLVTMACGSAAPSTVTGGFTSQAVDYLAANHLSGGIAYLIQTSAAAANPAWGTGADQHVSAMASFLPTLTARGADALHSYMRHVATGAH